MFHPRPLHGVSSPLPVRPSPERSPPKLCENGRAYITEASTGQQVCLCQLEAHPAHSLQAHPALRGVGRALPAHRTPRSFADLHTLHQAAQLSAMSPFGEQTNGLLPPHIAFHPYGAMYPGLEGPGSPLRRAATRETTGPLKAWLNEHKKNPYPTKAEKIMLAIITRMTLTQVSTWFANARRRLKKDNRLGGGDADGDDDTSMLDIDSDREGDSDTTSVDAHCLATPVIRPGDGDRTRPGTNLDEDRSGVPEKEEQASLRSDAKLSSEGEIDPDSFSDISDDENDIYRSLRAGAASRHEQARPVTSCTARVPVITSPPAALISGHNSYTESAIVTDAAAKGSASSGLGLVAPGVDLSLTSTTTSATSSSSSSSITPSTPAHSSTSVVSAPAATKSPDKLDNKAGVQKAKPKIWSISHILDS